MMNVLWKMPVSLDSLTGVSGLRELMGRSCLLVLATKEDDGGDIQIVFEGVEAYKVTFYHARCSLSTEVSFGELVDRGETDWLNGIKKCMIPGLDRPGKLYDLAFDSSDGPCYEFICRSYKIEDTYWQDIRNREASPP
jgi:hypothetical protein